MSYLLRFRGMVFVGGVALLVAIVAMAQERANPNLPQRGGQPGAVQQGSSGVDARLAACLSVSNQNEVALAQLAQQRAESNEVKQFAEMLQQDHSKMLQTLRQYTGERQAAQDARQEPARQGEQLVRTPQSPHNGVQRGPLDLVSLSREIGAQCLQSARQELDQKRGSEFDQCYLGMQIAAHMQVIDTMIVFKNHASANLRETLDGGIKTARHHLEKAKELAKTLAKGKNERAALD